MSLLISTGNWWHSLLLFRVMYVVFIPMGLQDTLEGERREVSDNYLGKANQKPVMNLLCRNPVFLWNIYGTLAIEDM